MNWFSGIKQFILDTVAELKKCTWPTKHELFESTILVIAALAILALFVAGVDEVCRVFVTFVTMK